MATQIGPEQIIEPIKGEQGYGSLLASVEVVEPLAAAAAELAAAEKALKAARAALAEETVDEGRMRSLRAAVTRAEATKDAAAERHAEARRWENGITYRPLGGCAPAQNWAPCSGDLLNIDPSAPIVKSIPWTVYAGFKCSTWALTEDERVGHAEARLNVRESQAIEDEVWNGTIAQGMGWDNPYLRSADTTVLNSGTALGIVTALGTLQKALRECLGSDIRGVIHAAADVVTAWDSQHLLDQDDRGRIIDRYGNVVVIGAGYDGSAPPTKTGTTWAYGTGPVRVLLGPVYMVPDDTAQALDRSVNDITWYAERTANAHWDPCCQYAVQVDISSLFGGIDGGTP